MLCNPRYGLTGLFSFPHFFFLEMIGPAIEVVGYGVFALSILLGIASTKFVIAFFTMSVVLGVVISLTAVAIEEYAFHRYKSLREVVELFVLAVVENFGYRQLTVYWRLRGMLRLLSGRNSWGTMERRGFASATPKGGDAPKSSTSRSTPAAAARSSQAGNAEDDRAILRGQKTQLSPSAADR